MMLTKQRQRVTAEADAAAEAEAALQDRVSEDGEFGEDLGDVRRDLPRPGTEKGRFFVQNEEDNPFDFTGRLPEFWIVRFAPKIEPEVWPTEAGAESGQAGDPLEGPGAVEEPRDPIFDPIFDDAPEAPAEDRSSSYDGPF